MTYPTSNTVTPGEATKAEQYNTLRADTLYLGQTNADSATLGRALKRYTDGIRFAIVSASVFSVDANESDPATLRIEDCFLQNLAAAQCSISHEQFPTPSVLHIFAECENSTTNFRIFVKTSVEETSGTRRIGRLTWSGLRILPESLFTLPEWNLCRQLQQPDICQGRLTLNSYDPCPVTDIGETSSVFFTPCTGNKISLYESNSVWIAHTFTQAVLDISGFSDTRCYDIFASIGEFGVQLSEIPWLTLAVRSAELHLLHGVYVCATDYSKRYLGTIGLSSIGKTQDTKIKRLVWNLYQPILRPLYKASVVTTDTRQAEGNRWCPVLNDTSLTVDAVIGMASATCEIEGCFSLTYVTSASPGLETYFGIGIDQKLTTPFDTNAVQSEFVFQVGVSCPVNPKLRNGGNGQMLGKHQYSCLMYSNGSVGKFVMGNTAYIKSGLRGYVLG